jgi:hypothetical protein
LLTNKAGLPAGVADEIRRLAPKTIVLVGGKGAISDKVARQLSALGRAKVVRVAGSDRFATSRAIIAYGMLTDPDFARVGRNNDGTYSAALTPGFLGTDHHGKPMDVSAGLAHLRFYFATGMNFPDALSIGAIGGNWLGAYPGPVFLEYGNGSSISEETVTLMTSLLKAWGSKVQVDAYIIGTPDVMSDALMRSAQSGLTRAAAAAGTSPGQVIRIGGKDRYETSRMIVDTLKIDYPQPDPAAFLPEGRQAVLAVGDKFPDALAGSAYAGAANSTLWIVPPSCVPAGVLATAHRLHTYNWALLGDTAGALLAPVDSLTSCGG